MAEQSVQHVVNQAQSVGDDSSIDVSGNLQTSSAISGSEGDARGIARNIITLDAWGQVKPEAVELGEVRTSITEGKDIEDDSNVS